MNNYQIIKNYIMVRLQGKKKVLQKDEIYKEVEDTKCLSNLGNEIFAKILGVQHIENISDKEWESIRKELENYFDISSKPGTLLQGIKQRNRNTTWWSKGKKQKCDNYYWNRYKRFLLQEKKFPVEVIGTIDGDTDNIMDNIGDPIENMFSTHGMVVGNVQSGKTSNYASLICKAADAGYKFILIIAGSINNLRNQTQERINEAFVGSDGFDIKGVGFLGNDDNCKKPVSLTTTTSDFNNRDAKQLSHRINFDNITSPIVLVIKKNTKTLTNVKDWLSTQYNHSKINNHSMLLIDDESDYASVNTKDEENPTTINYKIRKLISLFEKSTYVAYTATPYANIFIDHRIKSDDYGKDLFPEDFIYCLKAPSNYIGARKIFIENPDQYLREINDYEDIIPLKHKKEFNLQELPKSLYEAIRVFIINVAIRNLRHDGDKHNSMLIHITRFTRVHQQIFTLVEEYVNKLRHIIISYGALDNLEYYDGIKDIKDTFYIIYEKSNFTWREVLDSICDTIETIVIREVHQETRVLLEYKDDEPTNAIVIGGTSVSRGFTLEGLSVSYFLRSTKFYDTLMQMGRWFGFRHGYDDLCKIYMSRDMMANFSLIIESTEELIENLEIMKENKMTPRHFGLFVSLDPSSTLQVTALNKQKNTKNIYSKMILDGHCKETSWIIKDTNTKKYNLNLIKQFITTLNQHEKIKNHYLWRGISKDTIYKFLDSFIVYRGFNFILNGRMPIEFIKEYVNLVNTDWDVALYSGEGATYNIGNITINKELRKIKSFDNYYEIKNRQVSSGIAESISLTKEERKDLGSNRKAMRNLMKRPLLMLHILETNEDKSLAAFGVSFPGGVSTIKRSTVIKVNTVYQEQLQKELEEDFDD